MICGWTWVPEDTSSQATSTYIKCKHWIWRKVRMVKTTVLFIWDQLLAALIDLNFITLILICFKLMMRGVNYAIYGCFSVRSTGVSLHWSFTLEENIIAVISQDRVIDDNLKRQIKNPTLCTNRSFYQPKFFNILAIGQRYFSFHPLFNIPT